MRRTRESLFSYVCNRCLRCCHGKRIRVNPYEVLRLARNRGLTTTEFLARHTTAGGTELATTAEGACVFLTGEGCGVHPDRPLVCRLYPLGRHLDGQGAETFSELQPHPETEGVYGTDSTVGQFLDGQGAAPFMAAADRYLGVVARLSATLGALAARDTSLDAAVRDTVTDAPASQPEWLDVDRTVAEYCRRNGRAVPDDVDATIALHIEALDAWRLTLDEGDP